MINYFKIGCFSESSFADVGESGMQYSLPCTTCKRNRHRIKPLSLTFLNNSPLGDFTWNAPDVFVSERCKELLSSFTDRLQFEEPHITGARKEKIWSVEISDTCGVASECGVQLIDKCVVCGHEFYSTWNGGLKIQPGCDKSIFRIYEYNGRIVVNEDMKTFIEKNKLTNIVFRPLSKMYDEDPWMRPFPKSR